MKNKYLITGATGYIGTQMALKIKSLSEDNEVTALTRKEVSAPHIDNYIVYDGTLDSVRQINFNDYVAVIHLAALFTTKDDLSSQIALLDSNILLSAQLFGTMSEQGSKIPIVSASTFSAYDRNGNYAPHNFYSATKKVIEPLAETYDINAIFITMSDTYGPNDSRPKVHNLIRDGKITQMNSKPTQKINLNHTDDITNAFLKAISLNDDNKRKLVVYDILNPANEITLKDLAEYLNPNVSFLSKQEDTEIPKQFSPIPGFEFKHNVKDIKEVI